MQSNLEAKLAGLRLGAAIKARNAAEPERLDLEPIEAALLAIAAKKDELKSEVSLTMPESNGHEIVAEAIKTLANRESIDLGGVESAIERIYQAMPEYDFSEIAAAIGDSPDIRPELLAIVRAIGDNTAAIKANTEAVIEQNRIMMRPRGVGLDAEGRINEIFVK